jgi:xanthine/uracil permease
MNSPESTIPTVRELLKQLTDQLSALFRQEVELASAEFSRSMARLLAGIASAAVGGVVLFGGFLMLLIAAVLGLAQWFEPWLAALIVGVAVSLVGVLLLVFGIRRVRPAELKPERAASSLQRDKDVLMRRAP